MTENENIIDICHTLLIYFICPSYGCHNNNMVLGKHLWVNITVNIAMQVRFSWFDFHIIRINTVVCILVTVV